MLVVTSNNGKLIIQLERPYLNSFLPSTISLWNSLPESLVNLDDINKFKEDLSLFLFPTD